MVAASHSPFPAMYIMTHAVIRCPLKACCASYTHARTRAVAINSSLILQAIKEKQAENERVFVNFVCNVLYW